MPLILVMAGLLAPFTSAVEVHLPTIVLSIALAEVKPPPPPTTIELIDQAAIAAGLSTSTPRAIAWCESHYRQFEADGSLRRGPDGHDIGVFQIRETKHLDAANKLGDDIYTTAGNIAYGIQLLKQSGKGPWVSSANCWRSLLKNPQLIPTTTPDE